jgi:3,4-dihydroxy 2-butanone 4-phosphate synthase / GTP cyclohydrolase II
LLSSQEDSRQSLFITRTGRILRAIGLGGQILSDLGIQRIRLLSNTPMHIPALEGFGLEIVEQVAIPVEECSHVGQV